MMRIETIAALRRALGPWRSQGERLVLVPTMGKLHAGHLQLVKRARELGDRVITSVFVNPIQFGAGEDFAAYPRTLEEDAAALQGAKNDLLFAPSVNEVYSRPLNDLTRVQVPRISDHLCGASRPGHFEGVATIVCKLFNMVQPERAVFGEKDYQQLLVIRRMTEDLNIPVEIIGVPTLREADGLAMSSRNSYLTPEQRALAPLLYQTLRATADGIRAGEDDFTALTARAAQTLNRHGFVTDYLEIRRASDLELPAEGNTKLIILAAARLGRARLIDNLAVRRPL